MKKSVKSLLLLVLVLGVTHSITAQKRTVNLASFSELSYGIPGTLYLRQGAQRVEIECSDATFAKIEFRISGDELIIESKDNRGWGNISKSDLTIYVTMENIDGVNLSGSGELIGEQSINADDLKLRISGSGDITLTTSASDLSAEISGSGKIMLSGKANSLKARISGSGNIKAENLTVDTVDASISGSGDVYITANEEITARVSGSGNVYYKGDPERRDSQSSGSGRIVRMNE